MKKSDRGCSDCPQGSPITRRRLFRGGAALGLYGGLFVPLRTAPVASIFGRSASPSGFPLPGGCSVVDGPHERAAGFRVWSVDCATRKNEARGLFGAVLSANGWMSCGVGLAKASWVKGGVLLAVHESSLKAGEYITVTQRQATIYDCGDLKRR